MFCGCSGREGVGMSLDKNLVKAAHDGDLGGR